MKQAMSTVAQKHDKAFHDEPLSRIEMQDEITERVNRIQQEFREAFEFIREYPRSVTFFGSARFRQDEKLCLAAKHLSSRIAKELQYTVLTGGGGGIMEAANRGSFEAGGESVGLNIKLPREQMKNGYTTDDMEIYYFFIRKVALSFAAEAYIFFPGGFGTLDEFFEIITLIQTRKLPRVPVILYGKEYWGDLHTFISKTLYKELAAIDEEDMGLYTITEDEDEILDIIKRAPILQHG